HQDGTVPVGARVGRARLAEGGAEDGLDEAIAQRERERALVCGRRELETGAARRADVGVVPGAGSAGIGADELDVVAQAALVSRGAPLPELRLAARAELERAGHDGCERRIGEEVVRQLAGRGRICTGELDRTRSAHPLAVAGVPGETGTRIEVGA